MLQYTNMKNVRELIKTLKNAESVDRLNALREDMAGLIPGIRVMFDFDQKSLFHQYDLWIHSLHVVCGLPRDIDDDMLYLGALLHDIGKPAMAAYSGKPCDHALHFKGHPVKSFEIVKNEILPKLKNDNFTGEELDRLLFYVEHHDDDLSITRKCVMKYVKMQNIAVFKRLLMLEISDAEAHVNKPIIVKRINTCRSLLDGFADELLKIERDKIS